MLRRSLRRRRMPLPQPFMMMIARFKIGMDMKENKCLNFMKGISCLTVVLLHCRIPGIIGDGIIYALRFPVPMFFMISGYFCYYKDTEWIKKAQLKILRLLLCSEAVCGVVCFWFGEEGVTEQLRKLAFWSHPLRTLFCGTLFNGTLWYLYAMLWTWLFLYLVKRTGGIGRSYGLIPVLLLIHIAGRLYIQETGDIEVWIYLFRSGLLYGIPFVLLGHFLAEKKPWIDSCISDGKCALLLVCGGGMLAAEYILWHCFMDIWFSTVLIVTAMFLFAVIHPDWEVIPAITKIGKKYSMIIYVSHIPLSLVLDGCLKPYMEETAYGWVRPFLTMAAALTTAAAADGIRRQYICRQKGRALRS